MSDVDTPLPGQQRCADCQRLLAGAWDYCPSCGASTADGVMRLERGGDPL